MRRVAVPGRIGCRRRLWIQENPKTVGGVGVGPAPSFTGEVESLAEFPVEDPGYSYSEANCSSPHPWEADVGFFRRAILPVHSSLLIASGERWTIQRFAGSSGTPGARAATPGAFALLLRVQPWLRAAPARLSQDQDVGRSADDLRVAENMPLCFEEAAA